MGQEGNTHGMSKEMMWKGLVAVSAMAAGAATRQLLQSAWRASRGDDPPTNPASPTTTWAEALTWAVASGVAMAVARLVAQRGAAGAWKAATGSYPKGLETAGP